MKIISLIFCLMINNGYYDGFFYVSSFMVDWAIHCVAYEEALGYC